MACRCQRFLNNIVNLQAKSFRNAASIIRIGFVEVLDLQLLDAARNGTHAGNNVADKPLLLIRLQQAEEVSRLGVIIVIHAMVMPGNGSTYRMWALLVSRIFLGPAKAVGFIVGL